MAELREDVLQSPALLRLESAQLMLPFIVDTNLLSESLFFIWDVSTVTGGFVHFCFAEGDDVTNEFSVLEVLEISEISAFAELFETFLAVIVAFVENIAEFILSVEGCTETFSCCGFR